MYVYNNADGPSLLSAASRKVHGQSGPVELPVTIFGRARTVEPRRGGPTTLRLTFSTDVFAADGVLDENDFDLVGAAFRSASVSGAVLTLGLGDVEDGSVVTVGFARLADRDGRAVQGSGQVQVEARYGDVDGSGVVNAADALLLRRATALRTAAPNLLLDLDLSGTVSAADLALLRRRLTAVSLLGALAVPLHEGTASAAGQWP